MLGLNVSWFNLIWTILKIRLKAGNLFWDCLKKKHLVSLGNFYKLRVKCHAFTWKLQRKRPWHMILICLINVLKVVTSGFIRFQLLMEYIWKSLHRTTCLCLFCNQFADDQQVSNVQKIVLIVRRRSNFRKNKPLLNSTQKQQRPYLRVSAVEPRLFYKPWKLTLNGVLQERFIKLGVIPTYSMLLKLLPGPCHPWWGILLSMCFNFKIHSSMMSSWVVET